VLATAGVLFLQTFVQHHLPIKDCLPFAVGNNILELRKMPKNAIPDKFDYTFTYEQNGKKQDFVMPNLPTDTTWKFVDRKQVLVQKGSNNAPLINDFYIKTTAGTDTTEALLNTPNAYYILFVQDIDGLDNSYTKDKTFVATPKENLPLFIVASNYAKAKQRYNVADNTIFISDATAIKTAARSKITLYKMKGPVVQQKWGMMELGE
jgi:hypothetical protein